MSSSVVRVKTQPRHREGYTPHPGDVGLGWALALLEANGVRKVPKWVGVTFTTVTFKCATLHRPQPSNFHCVHELQWEQAECAANFGEGDTVTASFIGDGGLDYKTKWSLYRVKRTGTPDYTNTFLRQLAASSPWKPSLLVDPEAVRFDVCLDENVNHGIRPDDQPLYHCCMHVGLVGFTPPPLPGDIRQISLARESFQPLIPGSLERVVENLVSSNGLQFSTQFAEIARR